MRLFLDLKGASKIFRFAGWDGIRNKLIVIRKNAVIKGKDSKATNLWNYESYMGFGRNEASRFLNLIAGNAGKDKGTDPDSLLVSTQGVGRSKAIYSMRDDGSGTQQYCLELKSNMDPAKNDLYWQLGMSDFLLDGMPSWDMDISSFNPPVVLSGKNYAW